MYINYLFVVLFTNVRFEIVFTSLKLCSKQFSTTLSDSVNKGKIMGILAYQKVSECFDIQLHTNYLYEKRILDII